MAGATRKQVEATVSTCRKNLAEAVEWFGPDSNQAAAIRRILVRSEANLRSMTKETA